MKEGLLFPGNGVVDFAARVAHEIEFRLPIEKIGIKRISRVRKDSRKHLFYAKKTRYFVSVYARRRGTPNIRTAPILPAIHYPETNG